MNELINIKNENGQQAVSARDLHEFLVVDSITNNVGEKYADWIKRMVDYGFDENIDYEIIRFNYLGHIIRKSDGQHVSKIEYILTLDCAKEISMLQKNEKGRIARKYFIDVEKKHRANAGAIDFSDPRAILKLAEDFVRESDLRLEAETKVERLTLTTEQQKKELKTSAPMVEYYEDVMQSNSLIAITVIASELGMSANKLNKTLHQQGVIYKNAGAWVLYNRHQGNGYTKTKTHTHTDHNGKEQTTIHTYWTEKGRAFIHSIIELLKKSA